MKIQNLLFCVAFFMASCAPLPQGASKGAIIAHSQGRVGRVTRQTTAPLYGCRELLWCNGKDE